MLFSKNPLVIEEKAITSTMTMLNDKFAKNLKLQIGKISQRSNI